VWLEENLGFGAFSFIASYCDENSPQTLTLKGRWQGTGCTSAAFRLQKILGIANSQHVKGQDRVDREKTPSCPFPSAAKASSDLCPCSETRDQGENLLCDGGWLLCHWRSTQPRHRVVFSPAKLLSLPVHGQSRGACRGLPLGQLWFLGSKAPHAPSALLLPLSRAPSSCAACHLNQPPKPRGLDHGPGNTPCFQKSPG